MLLFLRNILLVEGVLRMMQRSVGTDCASLDSDVIINVSMKGNPLIY